MIEYVGNFSEYIPEKLYEHLMSPPKVSKPFIERCDPKLKVYDSTSSFTYKINDDVFELNFTLPIEIFGEIVEVWFVRLDPGDVITLHQDAYDVSAKDHVRYTMYLQDYAPGHIFIHSDTIVVDYKAGDIYKFDDALVWHAAGNLGLQPRITAQILAKKFNG
jgi:hypothetical protein